MLLHRDSPLSRTQHALTTLAPRGSGGGRHGEPAMPSLVRTFASSRATVLLALAVASLAACRKKPQPAPAPAPTQTTTTTTVNEDSIRRVREREQFVRDSIEKANR